MKEFTIYYKSTEEDGVEFVGSGYGETKEEAIKDFLFWHNDCIEITSVELYK